MISSLWDLVKYGWSSSWCRRSSELSWGSDIPSMASLVLSSATGYRGCKAEFNWSSSDWWLCRWRGLRWINISCWCWSLLPIPRLILDFSGGYRCWIATCCWCRSQLFPLVFLIFCRTFVVTLDLLRWFLSFIFLWWRMPPLWMWIWRRMCVTRIAQEDGKVHKSHAVHWFNEEARLFAGFPAFHKLTECREKESLLCVVKVLSSMHFHFSWSELTRACLE